MSMARRYRSAALAFAGVVILVVPGSASDLDPRVASLVQSISAARLEATVKKLRRCP